MSELEFYLNSLTLEELCRQKKRSYEAVKAIGITKKQFIELELKAQENYNKILKTHKNEHD